MTFAALSMRSARSVGVGIQMTSFPSWAMAGLYSVATGVVVPQPLKTKVSNRAGMVSNVDRRARMIQCPVGRLSGDKSKFLRRDAQVNPCA